MFNVWLKLFNKIELKSMFSSEELAKFYYKKSRLQQLKGFYYTYLKGSAVKASEEMGLGASTITMQVKSLEKDLNVKLFVKQNNKLIPTAKADLLYKMCVPVIQGADSLFKTFLQSSNEIDENYIHLACHPNVSYEILPKVMRDFKDVNPKTVFEIENISFEEAIEKVANEEIDFAIYPTDENKRKHYELEFEDFYEDEVVLVMYKDCWLASKNEKNITKDDIAKTNLVCMDKSLFIKHKYLDFLLNNKNFCNDLLFVNSNWETIKSMVKEGLCTAGVSEHYINEYDKRVLIVKKLRNIFPTFKYCIIFKSGIYFKNCVENFLNLLRDKYKNK